MDRPLGIKHKVGMIWICIFLLTSITAKAQDNLPPELVGQWQIDIQATMAAVSETTMEVLDSNSALKNQIMDSYTGRSISMDANGNFQQFLANGASVNGTWNVSEGVLQFTTDTGATQSQDFSVLPDGRLWVSLQGNSQHIVPEQYYIKQ